MTELTIPFTLHPAPYARNPKSQTRKMEATKEKRARDVLAVMQERDEVPPLPLSPISPFRACMFLCHTRTHCTLHPATLANAST
jgi:hypothetical protein